MNEIFLKQILLEDIGILGQQKIENLRLAIVGCGGLGCSALLYAVRSGLCHISIFDDDRVELSNLSRQILYSKQDIGRPKVDVAKEYFADWTQLAVYPIKITPDNLDLLENCDVILDCADNLETSILLDSYAKRADKTLLFCGVDRWQAQIAILDKDSPNLADFIQKSSTTTCEAGILTPLLGICGSLLISELIKYLVLKEDSLYNQILFLDLQKDIFKRVSVGNPVLATTIEPVEYNLTPKTLVVDVRGRKFQSSYPQLSLQELYLTISDYQGYDGSIAIFCDNFTTSSKIARGLQVILPTAKIFAVEKDILFPEVS